MSGKEFLKDILYIDRLIDCKLEDLENLKYRLVGVRGVNYDSDKVQGSGSKNNYVKEEIIDKIIKLEKSINDKIDELVDIKKKASELIDKIDNMTYRVILYKRYFKGDSMEEISVYCNYSWRWINKLHSKALIEFDKLYKESLK